MSSMQSKYVRDLIRESNLWNRPLSEIRRSMEELQSAGTPEGIQNSRETILGVDCEVFNCEGAAKDKVILYYHGGGFCLGIYPSNRDFAAGIAKGCKANLYMPDYRLAPEDPYPAALEDAAAVYRGMLELGYHAEDILIMGDSSGGALSVSALLKLKAEGVPMPQALVYITPVFDFTGQSETYISRRQEDPFHQENPLAIAKIYVGSNDPASPLISPLYGNLEGWPPVFIHSGDYDVFSGDSDSFSKAICQAGGIAEHKKWEEMWHIFPMQAAFVPEAGEALEELYSYVKKSLNIS